MSLSATYAFTLSVVETFTSALLLSTAKTLTTNGASVGATLTGASGTPVTTQAAGSKAMSAGAATLDLRAILDDVTSRTLDGNGLKLQLAILTNPATNANPITIVGGASNGYLFLGAAGSVILKPGQTVALLGAEQLPDIDATHKTIDISGTLAQTLSYHFVMG